MPLSDAYDDIRPFPCPACNLARLQFDSVETSPRVLRIHFRCSACAARCAGYFDLLAHEYRAPLAAFEDLAKMPMLHCQGACEWQAVFVRVEAGSRFLRVHGECPTCGAKFARYFDLEQHGYVMLSQPVGNRPTWTKNWPNFRGQRPYTVDGCVLYTLPSDFRQALPGRPKGR